MVFFWFILIIYLWFALSSSENKNAELQSRIEQLEEELEEAKDEIIELENEDD